jgi:prevent-host-death family protein
MQISATEAKDRFGEIMAARETVTITKYGKPDKAVIDFERLRELEATEDRYWSEMARQGQESGPANPDDVRRLFDRMVKAAGDEELTELYRRITNAPDRGKAKGPQKPGKAAA